MVLVHTHLFPISAVGEIKRGLVGCLMNTILLWNKTSILRGIFYLAVIVAYYCPKIGIQIIYKPINGFYWLYMYM